MTQTPTDALRLVPVEPTPEMMNAAWVAFRNSSWHDLTPSDIDRSVGTGAFREAWRTMLAAAPASPLPGGGDMDWQDRAEGLESDLRQAVLVAWKRGAEQWCRLNYPQWVDWLEACHAPACLLYTSDAADE